VTIRASQRKQWWLDYWLVEGLNRVVSAHLPAWLMPGGADQGSIRLLFALPDEGPLQFGADRVPPTPSAAGT